MINKTEVTAKEILEFPPGTEIFIEGKLCLAELFGISIQLPGIVDNCEKFRLIHRRKPNYLSQTPDGSYFDFCTYATNANEKYFVDMKQVIQLRQPPVFTVNHLGKLERTPKKWKVENIKIPDINGSKKYFLAIKVTETV